MAKDLWLPNGYELADGSKIRTLLFSGEDWQIFNTQGAGSIMIVRPELAQKWCEAGFIDEALLGSMTFGSASFRSLSSQRKYVLAPVEHGESPDNKVDAIAFSLALKESRKLSENFSGGVALRYIRSDLSGGFGGSTVGLENRSAGNAVATDVSFYYRSLLGSEGSPNTIAAGINLSNIGSKISYNQGSTKEFLPANMRIGTTFTTQLNDSNSLSLSLDLNKLLVPTPVNIITHGADGSEIIMPNNNSSKSVISSIFSSFGDAPGGLSEELKEFTLSMGAEYLYRNQFALRTGYFNESQFKGNRKYFTVGVGVKLHMASVDVSYVVPVEHNNPLANTVRFSLLFNTDSFSKRKKDDVSKL